LFSFEPSTKNTNDFLTIIKRVAAFRKGQAADKRAADALKEAKLKTEGIS
jgi:hypothetical protein